MKTQSEPYCKTWKEKIKFLIKQIEQANERKRVQIECAVWHLDVGLAHPHERRNHEEIGRAHV